MADFFPRIVCGRNYTPRACMAQRNHILWNSTSVLYTPVWNNGNSAIAGPSPAPDYRNRLACGMCKMKDPLVLSTVQGIIGLLNILWKTARLCGGDPARTSSGRAEVGERWKRSPRRNTVKLACSFAPQLRLSGNTRAAKRPSIETGVLERDRRVAAISNSEVHNFIPN